jgi:hypothetical protein
MEFVMKQPQNGRKRSAQDEESENKDKKKKKKKDEGRIVEEAIQTLQDKHGKEFTPMQYCIYAEMHVGGGGAISLVLIKHLPIQCFSELVELL